ncbi:MAG: hypothetical protein DMD33_17055 [Gemmatimonadetes bacterium]|nr:MAG: hypothetical protein DMD33_17055 [Gemmatimonadota bacterium]PYO79457.1 MAG: hypothetical protein DMD67_02685 [Gemmatimonadota bacterium]PYO96705.1 MAG: hypothetical protein DMD61_13730 [Gemmatimonadota bacterium]TLY55844.1 MAG: hypothetical protein E6K55_02355 [Gemmatimonadota bacterium]
MAQFPMKLIRLMAVAWCGFGSLSVGACARHHNSSTTPDPSVSDSTPSSRTPATLRVTNSHWSDVRIYLVRGAMWTRLGLVTTNSTVEFIIPPDLLSGASTITLVADPVAGTGRWTTPLPVVSPGDEFELVVENFLQYSHLVVR